MRRPTDGLLLALFLCGVDGASATAIGAECESNPLRRPYFGDAHVHTRYSLDAATQGTTVSPHDSYEFALGNEIGIQPHDPEGNPLRTLKLDRPLDFAVVTDHAEFFGEVELCTNPEFASSDPLTYYSPECVVYRERPDEAFLVFNLNLARPADPVALPGEDKTISRFPYCGVGGAKCLAAAKTPWGDVQAAAALYNDPCHFTTFVGYEWSASPRSNNLHRNVIFRNESVPDLPASYFDAPEPEILWKALGERCTRSGEDPPCDYLTIPHNSNLAGGMMFQEVDSAGNPFTAEYAEKRHVNEPLAEIFQHKGDSECLPGPGVADELCGFEKLPFNNLATDRFGLLLTNPPVPSDFLRNALKDGLLLEESLGANPYEYGLIGSTDTHIGAPGAARETDFPGHGGAGAPSRDEVPKGLSEQIAFNPGGLAVVWAEENTRESLFAAMKRREVYGTSGTRIHLRFFGGFDLRSGMCARHGDSFARSGYRDGVPMGGVLSGRACGGAGAPRFAVWAMKDSADLATPLERVQIIKGWIEREDGRWIAKEKVNDVAGTAKNGWRLDETTCETSIEEGTTGGEVSLCAEWTDPDFDPSERAFYYARVVENPTCRWSARQCLNAPSTMDCADASTVPEEWRGCCDARFPKSVQERAWSSPIWFKP